MSPRIRSPVAVFEHLFYPLSPAFPTPAPDTRTLLLNEASFSSYFCFIIFLIELLSFFSCPCKARYFVCLPPFAYPRSSLTLISVLPLTFVDLSFFKTVSHFIFNKLFFPVPRPFGYFFRYATDGKTSL